MCMFIQNKFKPGNEGIKIYVKVNTHLAKSPYCCSHFAGLSVYVGRSVCQFVRCPGPDLNISRTIRSIIKTFMVPRARTLLAFVIPTFSPAPPGQTSCLSS